VVIAGSRVHDRSALLEPEGRVTFARSLISARKRCGNGHDSCDIGRYRLIADGLVRIFLFPVFDQLSRYLQRNFWRAADGRNLDRIFRPDSKLEIKKLIAHEGFDVPQRLIIRAFGVQRSAFTVHRSPFTVHRSPFTVQRSAFSVGRRRSQESRDNVFVQNEILDSEGGSRQNEYERQKTAERRTPFLLSGLVYALTTPEKSEI
jgi:hypothetical protein